MAHDNTEIEIKISLSKKRFEEIEKKLKKIAKFGKSSHHQDDYYTPKEKSFLLPKYPYEWLTIRNRDGIVKFNYKHWYPPGVKYTTHCDEYEVVVEDKSQLAKILKRLKFRKFIRIDKKRLTYIYQNKFEIALDKVKELGYFLEIESLKDLGGLSKTRAQMLVFLKSIGITKTKTIPGGYASLLMSHKGLLQ